MTADIHIINGPNLNLLGTRETALYGTKTLQDIENECRKSAENRAALHFFQSNHEGALVDHIQSLISREALGLVINAGAYTHTSVAIHDALRCLSMPIIEVHVTNLHQRETFRHHSYISTLAEAVMFGFGTDSYRMAVEYILNRT